jgi:hypothetical protein
MHDDGHRAESDGSLPGGSLPDEDPIEAVRHAVQKDDAVPIEGVEPGVDPDSADSSSSLKRTDR